MDASKRLIWEFCEWLRLGEPESIGRGAPLDINGVTCSITKSRSDEANTLVLYCEFGAVPSGREVAIYQEILVQNFVGSLEGGAVFGFSPVAKHVVCMQTLSANAFSAQRLGDILQHMAEKALVWRETYFLKPAAGPSLHESVGLPSSVRSVLGGTRAVLSAKLLR